MPRPWVVVGVLVTEPSGADGVDAVLPAVHGGRAALLLLRDREYRLAYDATTEQWLVYIR